MMAEALTPSPAATLDPLLSMAHTRLPACPLAAQDDLLACLIYLRDVRNARGDSDEKTESIAAVDRHHARVITMSSRGLARHEDRALSLMAMAITAMRDNTPSSNAQAERTLRQIRLTKI
jgi:hypothetical protein